MRGRKQQYETAADKQRAYRQRKLDQKRNKLTVLLNSGWNEMGNGCVWLSKNDAARIGINHSSGEYRLVIFTNRIHQIKERFKTLDEAKEFGLQWVKKTFQAVLDELSS